MRYNLPTNKLINRLVPHYLSGRNYILFLQSLVFPLKTLNEKFEQFAHEKHIEARMTSQIIYFEWYLNYKLTRFFVDNKEHIFIKESTTLGVEIYHEDALHIRPFTVWYEGETIEVTNDEENARELHLFSEEKSINKVSFVVHVPEINMTTKEFVYMLSFIVNTYKLAGKTYLIKIDGEEIKPNTNTNI